MEAIRKSRIRRKGNEIVVQLPDSFTANEVDVIVWASDNAIDENKETANINSFSEYLLNWPEMSDEELQSIEEKRKQLNQWK